MLNFLIFVISKCEMT